MVAEFFEQPGNQYIPIEGPRLLPGYEKRFHDAGKPAEMMFVRRCRAIELRRQGSSGSCEDAEIEIGQGAIQNEDGGTQPVTMFEQPGARLRRQFWQQPKPD